MILVCIIKKTSLYLPAEIIKQKRDEEDIIIDWLSHCCDHSIFSVHDAGGEPCHIL